MVTIMCFVVSEKNPEKARPTGVGLAACAYTFLRFSSSTRPLASLPSLFAHIKSPNPLTHMTSSSPVSTTLPCPTRGGVHGEDSDGTRADIGGVFSGSVFSGIVFPGFANSAV